jgi:guanylate kinase
MTGDAIPAAPSFPVVLAGPSGSGKTTVARRLAADATRFRFSVSATTREPRTDERNGVDYWFVDRSEFTTMRERDELLEWAEVHGELYGTPRSEVEAARREGVHLLLDIDVQGARSVRRLEPDVVTIFLLPPTGERIVARLEGRGSEGEAERRRRMRTAEQELGAVGEFEFVVINDVLDEAVESALDIVRSEEQRISRMGERVSLLAQRIEDQIRRTLGLERDASA